MNIVYVMLETMIDYEFGSVRLQVKVRGAVVDENAAKRWVEESPATRMYQYARVE